MSTVASAEPEVSRMAAQATAERVTRIRRFVQVRAIGEIDAETAPLFENSLSVALGPPPAVLVVTCTA
jgi:anti-anti-sigma regulatory factor